MCVVGSSNEEHSSQSALELLFEMQEKARIRGRKYRTVAEEAMQEYLQPFAGAECLFKEQLEKHALGETVDRRKTR